MAGGVSKRAKGKWSCGNGNSSSKGAIYPRTLEWAWTASGPPTISLCFRSSRPAIGLGPTFLVAIRLDAIRLDAIRLDAIDQRTSILHPPAPPGWRKDGAWHGWRMAKDLCLPASLAWSSGSCRHRPGSYPGCRWTLAERPGQQSAGTAGRC